MVVLESMALGVPIVTFDSDGGGPREIIQDNGCGLLVPPGDVDKMAETIERLLSDVGLRGTCIAGGLARVQDYEAPAIFDVRVVGRMPRISAAPPGP